MLPESLFKLWIQTPNVYKKMSFSLLRGGPKVSITNIGNPQMTGTAIVAFYPSTKSAEVMSNVAEYRDPPHWFRSGNHIFAPLAYTYPHIIINVEEQATYEIDLPYVDIQPAFDMLFPSHDEQDWHVAAFTLNPLTLNSGLTPPELTFQVFVSYPDMKMMSPIIPQIGEVGISGKLEYVSSILANGSKSFPFLTPWALAAKTAAGIASLMGFARPPVVPITTLVEKDHGSLCFTTGQPSFPEKLALDPAVALSVAPVVPLSTEGETRISSICGREGIIIHNAALTTAPLIFNVVPASCITNFSDGDGFTCQLTPLGYVGGAFQYWTGSIRIRIEIVANPFLRGKFGIVILPPNAPEPVTFPSDSTYLTHIMNVAGRTSFAFDVPYFYSKPFTLVESISSIPAGLSRTRIAIFELQPVQGPTITPVPLNCNVYMSAGKDFCYALPNLTWINEFTPVSPITPEGANDDPEPALKIFGSHVYDVLSLTRRLCKCAAFNNAAAYVVISLPFYGFIPERRVTFGGGLGSTAITLTQLQWTYQSYFSRMFLGMRGGQEWVFRPSSNCVFDGNIDHGPQGRLPSGFHTFNPNLPAGAQDLSPAGTVCEDNLTFFHTAVSSIEPNTYVPTRYSQQVLPTVASESDNFVISMWPTNGSIAWNTSIYTAGHDDFTLQGFLGVPMLYTYDLE